MNNKVVIYSDGKWTHLFVDGKRIVNNVSIKFEHSTSAKINIPKIEIGLDALPAKEADLPKELSDEILQTVGIKENSPSK